MATRSFQLDMQANSENMVPVLACMFVSHRKSNPKISCIKCAEFLEVVKTKLHKKVALLPISLYFFLDQK